MKIHSLHQLVVILNKGNLYYTYDNTVIELSLHKSTVIRKNLTTGNVCSAFDYKGYIDLLIDDKIELRYGRNHKGCIQKS